MLAARLVAGLQGTAMDYVAMPTDANNANTR